MTTTQTQRHHSPTLTTTRARRPPDRRSATSSAAVPTTTTRSWCGPWSALVDPWATLAGAWERRPGFRQPTYRSGASRVAATAARLRRGVHRWSSPSRCRHRSSSDVRRPREASRTCLACAAGRDLRVVPDVVSRPKAGNGGPRWPSRGRPSSGTCPSSSPCGSTSSRWPVATVTSRGCLSLWNPPAFAPGCSQLVTSGPERALLRNYDYDPALFEGVSLSSQWGERRVIGTSDCLWGLLDGMNDRGLAVSLTFGGLPGTGGGFAIPLVVRYLLEVCDTVDRGASRDRRDPRRRQLQPDVDRPVGGGGHGVRGAGTRPGVLRHAAGDEPPWPGAGPARPGASVPERRTPGRAAWARPGGSHRRCCRGRASSRRRCEAPTSKGASAPSTRRTTGRTTAWSRTAGPARCGVVPSRRRTTRCVSAFGRPTR